MFFYVTITAKEKTNLQNFLVFFLKINSLIPQILKFRPQKKHNKVITILKSPHINKTAQEQFEFKFFKRQIILFSLYPSLYFSIIKRITKKRFPGVKIKLACGLDKKKQNKILLSFFNPDNTKLKKKTSNKNFKNYLKLFDVYGELCLKNFEIQM